MKNIKLFGIIALIAVIGFSMTGCDTPTNVQENGLHPVTPTSAAVSPTVATVGRGGTLQLTATIGPTGAPQTVNWTIEPQGSGTITAGGLLTVAADAPLGLLAVTATAANHPTVLGSAIVTVTADAPPAPESVSVIPPTATLAQGGTLQFATTVAPAGASSAVTWSVEPPASGTITAGGLLTVPANAPAGTFVVRATAVGHGTVSGAATVTVGTLPTGAPASVSVSPPTAIVAQGGTLQLTAAVVPATASQSVTWNIVPATSGVTVTSEGLLTVASYAPIGSLVVTAAASNHPAVLGAAIVTITADALSPPASVVVTPPAATVPRGGTQQFAAAVLPVLASPAVTWSVEPSASGAITAGGLLTVSTDAPLGALTVRATASSTAVSGTATITVTADPGPHYVYLHLVRADLGFAAFYGVTSSRIINEGHNTVSWLAFEYLWSEEVTGTITITNIPTDYLNWWSGIGLESANNSRSMGRMMIGGGQITGSSATFLIFDEPGIYDVYIWLDCPDGLDWADYVAYSRTINAGANTIPWANFERIYGGGDPAPVPHVTITVKDIPDRYIGGLARMDLMDPVAGDVVGWDGTRDVTGSSITMFFWDATPGVYDVRLILDGTTRRNYILVVGKTRDTYQESCQNKAEVACGGHIHCAYHGFNPSPRRRPWCRTR